MEDLGTRESLNDMLSVLCLTPEQREYKTFLQHKIWTQPDCGRRIELSDIHESLFSFQKAIVQWAVKKGRAAIFEGTGLGKTRQQIEWARLVSARALIVCPLSVAQQTIAEGQKIDVKIKWCDRPESGDGIWITNYQKLKHFIDSDYEAIVLDECFVAGTQVDTPKGTRPIEDLKKGDLVYSAKGISQIKATRKSYHGSLALTSIQGRDIISSINHLFFTQRGWIKAKNLQGGDTIVYTTEAMRMVQGGVCFVSKKEQNDEILREILLSEMENEQPHTQSESSHARNSSQAGKKQKRLVQRGVPRSNKSTGENSLTQSQFRSESQGENLKSLESNRPQTPDSRGKWQGTYETTIDSFGEIRNGVESGKFYFSRETSDWISVSLQSRLSSPREENNSGSRRIQPCCHSSESVGQEEGRKTLGVRVDYVTIYQSDDPLFTRYRDETNRVAFYDLEIEGHPSFSICGLLVHNSSIIKGFTGATRNLLIDQFSHIPYRLCCTATPSPNDISELTNHAEFLGVMKRQEMLAHFFVHDSEGSASVGGWRLKGHAKDEFWKWMASWSIYIRQPSDLGFPDDGFLLPPLNIQQEFVKTNYIPEGQLFPSLKNGIRGRSEARRNSQDERVQRAVEIIGNSTEQWVIWCGLNDEQSAIAKALGGRCVSIEGSTPDEKKITWEQEWRRGEKQIIVTKAAIFGFGLNWFHCHNVMYLGMNDSMEQFYQSVRRCWRFGQQHPVNVVIVSSEAEKAIIVNVQRKEQQMAELAEGIVQHMKAKQIEEVRHLSPHESPYEIGEEKGEHWRALLGDAIERIREIPDNHVALSVTSIPFANLYTYSPSERDLGNAKGYEEFFAHFDFLIKDWLRVTMPGRRAAVHVQQVAMTLVRDGVIGWYDFRADVVRNFVKHGWIYDGEAVINRNPQSQSIRTHAKGLAFQQKNKNSAWSRPAMADYILLFRKDGESEPVKTDVTNEEWILWAEPIWNMPVNNEEMRALEPAVWNGINETETLNAAEARETDDERHICPLQLGTIERCIRLWSNKGEVVFDPFGGIFSTGYKAIELERKALLIELKKSYFMTGVKNMKRIEQQKNGQLSLFTKPIEQNNGYSSEERE